MGACILYIESDCPGRTQGSEEQLLLVTLQLLPKEETAGSSTGLIFLSAFLVLVLFLVCQSSNPPQETDQVLECGLSLA